MLDTNVPGEGRGELGAERLTWLDERLSEQPNQPTILFMHHPPFTTGIDLMDGYGLTGLTNLETIVKKYSCIERIGCGHIHRPIQKLWAGTLAYQLHLWDDTTGLVSHLQYINSYDGPYPFFKSENT